MEKIRAAVVGVGYLGRFHAQKYSQVDGCELVAVVDARAEAREAVAAELGMQGLADYRELLGKRRCGERRDARRRRISRSRATSSKPARTCWWRSRSPRRRPRRRELIELARRQQRILQVGHLERFNSAILAAEPYLTRPRFIECHRLAPYRERGTDVNVVLDLMIHDIDIVQTIVDSPIAVDRRDRHAGVLRRDRHRECAHHFRRTAASRTRPPAA